MNIDELRSLIDTAEAFRDLNDESGGGPVVEPDIELEWSITPETMNISDEIKSLVLKALFA